MIRVYSKRNCIQCTMTQNVLRAKGVPFEVVNMDENPEALALVQSWGFKAAPVVDADGERWSGFRDDLIRKIAAECETRAAGKQVYASGQ